MSLQVILNWKSLRSSGAHVHFWNTWHFYEEPLAFERKNIDFENWTVWYCNLQRDTKMMSLWHQQRYQKLLSKLSGAEMVPWAHVPASLGWKEPAILEQGALPSDRQQHPPEARICSPLQSCKSIGASSTPMEALWIYTRATEVRTLP